MINKTHKNNGPGTSPAPTGTGTGWAGRGIATAFSIAIHTEYQLATTMGVARYHTMFGLSSSYDSIQSNGRQNLEVVTVI
jgi:hypothetical protein